MASPYYNPDTICAESTPRGFGGVSVIRVSGPAAMRILVEVCPGLKPVQANQTQYCVLKSALDETIDEVCVVYFSNPKSFTGEDVVEITTHGSPIIVDQTLLRLKECGARPANKGEFTYRAFLNGKLDLIQAESILALIHSESAEHARLNLRQLRGQLSSSVSECETELLRVLAHIEADIDFSLEGLSTFSQSELGSRLKEISQRLSSLASGYLRANSLKQGFKVVLVGQPNVGKSSLFNRILGDSRSIVSQAPGTTRDYIEATLNLDGHKVVFVDTAGLRSTSEEVEQLGVERSRQQISSADLVLHIKSAVETDVTIGKKTDVLLEGEKDQRWRTVLNKCDLISAYEKSEMWCDVSAATGMNVNWLMDLISSEIKNQRTEINSAAVTQRQHDLLVRARQKIDHGYESLIHDAPPEVVALDLREGLDALLELVGKKFDDNVLDKIFSEFCLGK